MYVQQSRKSEHPCLSTVLLHRLASVVVDFKMVQLLLGLCTPSQDSRGSHPTGWRRAQPHPSTRSSLETWNSTDSQVATHPSRPRLTHLAQYEGVNEAIMARTIFCYLFVSAPWSDALWSLHSCSVCYWRLLYVSFSRPPLRMADSTLGRLYGIWFHCVHAHGPLEVCAISDALLLFSLCVGSKTARAVSLSCSVCFFPTVLGPRLVELSR